MDVNIDDKTNNPEFWWPGFFPAMVLFLVISIIVISDKCSW